MTDTKCNLNGGQVALVKFVEQQMSKLYYTQDIADYLDLYIADVSHLSIRLAIVTLIDEAIIERVDTLDSLSARCYAMYVGVTTQAKKEIKEELYMYHSDYFTKNTLKRYYNWYTDQMRLGRWSI